VRELSNFVMRSAFFTCDAITTYSFMTSKFSLLIATDFGCTMLSHPWLMRKALMG